MKIARYENKCVGCLYCGLMCSFVHEKSFNPSKGRIAIKNIGDRFEITFLDTCVNCGTCAKYCVYGALVATDDENEAER